MAEPTVTILDEITIAGRADGAPYQGNFREDPFMRVRQIFFGSKVDKTIALITINGDPGRVQVSGNPISQNGPVKTGQRQLSPSVQSPPGIGGYITGTLGAITDDPDNFLINLFGTDYDGGGHSRVPVRYYIDHYLLPSVPGSSFAGWGPVFDVTSTSSEGLTITRHFRGYLIQGPPSKEVFTDLFQQSIVIAAPPAPIPGHPLATPIPPATLTFSIGRLPDGGTTIAGTVTAVVTGYEPTKPTAEVPSPPAMAFVAQSDGSIKVTDGVELWSFTQTQPDMATGNPRNVVYKFNNKGPVA